MLSKKIEKALNDQIQVEAMSSQIYLAMASWAETEGLNGTSSFLYRHSDEERSHMLKLVKYVNDRGGKAIIPMLGLPKAKYKDIRDIFNNLLSHETQVTAEINEVVDACLKAKDYTTHNFMQWYVAEQIEEEGLARELIDKLNLIGKDTGGLYLFDRDLENLQPDAEPTA